MAVLFGRRREAHLVTVVFMALMFSLLVGSHAGAGAAGRQPAAVQGLARQAVKAISGKRILIRVKGQRLGKKAILTLTGIGGSAKGRERTVRVNRTRTVKRLKTGRYSVRARNIVRGDRTARAGSIRPAKLKVTRKNGARVVVRYKRIPVAPPDPEGPDYPEVSGTVLDPDGHPIAGYPICTVASGGWFDGVECLESTDSEGRFTARLTWPWPAPTNDIKSPIITLTVGNPYQDLPWKTKVAVPGVNTVQPREYATGTVRIGSEQGPLLPHADVCITPFSSKIYGGPYYGDPVCQRTDDAGHFRIRLDRHGDLAVTSRRVLGREEVEPGSSTVIIVS